MKCGDCKFWREEEGRPFDGEDDPPMGNCHRYAPRSGFAAPLVLMGRLHDHGSVVEDPERCVELTVEGSWRRCIAWPATASNDFCGEFEVASGKGPSYV